LKKLDFPMLVVGLVVSIVAVCAAIEKPRNRLDDAQAAFERTETPKRYDFAAWRKAGDMSCQNAATLRICRAHPVVASAIDGQPVRDFMSFACSATECAWVDP
jgi:hypothetical protein